MQQTVNINSGIPHTISSDVNVTIIQDDVVLVSSTHEATFQPLYVMHTIPGPETAIFDRDSIAISETTIADIDQPRFETIPTITVTSPSPDYPALPLQSNLTDTISNLDMIYTRNSEAYNIDYTLVNSNIPRFWPLGTKNV